MKKSTFHSSKQRNGYNNSFVYCRLLVTCIVPFNCLIKGTRNQNSPLTQHVYIFFGLVFCLTSRSTTFQSFWDGATASWVFTSTLGTLKCLAKEPYTAVMGFEPWTSRSGVRSSTTEPLRPPMFTYLSYNT